MNAIPFELDRAQDLHTRILEAHALLLRAERDLALLLAEMGGDQLFRALGYASLRDYGEHELQLDPRKTRGLARLGRRLPKLPFLDEAMSSGKLGWTKARDLLPVITPETEAAWVEVAMNTRSRELERLVAAHEPGDLPDVSSPLEHVPERMVFTMQPAEAELVRTLLSTLRAAAGVSREEVSDGSLLAQAAQRLLADLDESEAPTGERFRILLQQCPRCGQVTEPEPVAEPDVTHVGPHSSVQHPEASCDAQVLDMLQGETRGHLTRTIRPTTRRVVLQRDGHRCQVPGCSNRLWLDLHHVRFFSRDGDHGEDNLLTVCCTHHRMIHEGLMAIERQADRLVFRFADGSTRTVRRS